jgi:hypothetical protein
MSTCSDNIRHHKDGFLGTNHGEVVLELDASILVVMEPCINGEVHFVGKMILRTYPQIWICSSHKIIVVFYSHDFPFVTWNASITMIEVKKLQMPKWVLTVL